MSDFGWLFAWAKEEGIDIPIDNQGRADIRNLLEIYNERNKGRLAEKIYNSEPLTIELPDETMPRSLSAKWANEDIKMPDGKIAHFVEGSKLHHKEVFAGKGTKTPIRDVERLVNKYGGKADNWQKIKGFGSFELNGKSFEGEIHWYEEPSVGRKEIKFKEK